MVGSLAMAEQKVVGVAGTVAAVRSVALAGVAAVVLEASMYGQCIFCAFYLSPTYAIPLTMPST
jgi:hypothetical protein